MSRRTTFLSLTFLCLGLVPAARAGHACVYKITGPKGGLLYLGGSIHALRSTDYPLPSAYNRAFDASERLVIEDDPNVSASRVQRFKQTGFYPRGDSLKNHLDPRTYDYLKRVFSLVKVREEDFSRLRPWALIFEFWSPTPSGISRELGIEAFLTRRARANQKPITGLESFNEHMEVISGLTDRQAEAVILLHFIPQAGGKNLEEQLLDYWRRGDVDALQAQDRAALSDFPAFYERLIDERNRNWIPKIERDLQSGHTYFVVVGAGHLGGPNGLLALLRARGYQAQPL